MHNHILDKYPTDYKGYLIRSDFRTGIKIGLCLMDEDLKKEQRWAIAAGLLFGAGAPKPSEAIQGIEWFLKCGKEESDNPQKQDQEIVTDWEIDNAVITSAFRKAYGIDITTAKMHWFEFNMLLADIGECAYTQIVQIRAKKIDSNMSREEKKYYQEQKERFKLPKKLTQEEIEKIAEFMRLAEGSE